MLQKLASKLKINFKSKFFKSLKIIIFIWGIFSLTIVLFASGFIFYETMLGNRKKKDEASKSDVRFVLNWCEIGDENIVKVLKSYDSPRFFNGDYLTAYKIEIKKINFDQIQKNISHPNSKWYKSNQMPKILDESVKLIDMYKLDIPWFPDYEKIKSSNYYVYPWSISTNGISPNATELILYNPSENIVYFFGEAN